MTSEKLNNYNYDSYYKFIHLDDNDYILSVNDAFNKIKVSFSTTEINIVIFGIYSFAVIIIIIISTFFANQISQPIQRLTEATDAVSKGDLNIKIKHKEHGELKDLLDGFNQMTSELKKNQIELAELEREAAWKEMAKQVAHEIKNPLTPMKLALQQLMISYKDKSKDFDKLFEKVSNTVLNQIDNLNQIASEFSHFAKMPSLKLETLDLLIILNDTVNMFMHENTKLNINTQLLNAIVDADLSQLRRMFINLIRNSMQADATTIDIKVYLENGKYKLLFTDNGKGISESEKEKIFDEHFTTKKQGMGLGLSLAKRLMTSIEGDIKLKSSSQESTTFELIFPAKSTYLRSMSKLTPHQYTALKTSGHLALTANAGSGKTFVLARKYLDALINYNLDISNIAAITFTEKAASELYLKISVLIDEKLSEIDNLTDKKKLEKIRRQLVSANISTIHSFCINILREYPVEAKLDARFIPIDENLSEELIELSVEEMIRSSFDDELVSEDLKYLIRIFGSKSRLQNQIVRLVQNRKNVFVVKEEIYSLDEKSIAESFFSKFCNDFNKSLEKKEK